MPMFGLVSGYCAMMEQISFDELCIKYPEQSARMRKEREEKRKHQELISAIRSVKVEVKNYYW